MCVLLCHVPQGRKVCYRNVCARRSRSIVVATIHNISLILFPLFFLCVSPPSQLFSYFYIYHIPAPYNNIYYWYYYHFILQNKYNELNAIVKFLLCFCSEVEYIYILIRIGTSNSSKMNYAQISSLSLDLCPYLWNWLICYGVFCCCCCAARRNWRTIESNRCGWTNTTTARTRIEVLEKGPRHSGHDFFFSLSFFLSRARSFVLVFFANNVYNIFMYIFSRNHKLLPNQLNWRWR